NLGDPLGRAAHGRNLSLPEDLAPVSGMDVARNVARVLHPDYLAAVGFWALGRTLRLQVHRVLSIALEGASAAEEPPSGLRFVAVRNAGELRNMGQGLEDQLNEESGPSCRSILDAGGSLYALAEGEQVACQLNIRRGVVAVDSPTKLTLSFPDGSAFLDFLHTRDDYRGRGLATALIRYACGDIARVGTRSCLAHVRATNHSSLRAFRRCGWERRAAIFTTRSGRFLAAPGCRQAGMDVDPAGS
ncbi:MAG: GNAT family N-acetyltransferase, partial [Gammaproteobacteria bacterium]